MYMGVLNIKVNFILFYLFYGLFNDAISISYFVTWNGKVL
jgi:hypothetical protein